jgi:uncharacterized protein
MNLQHSPADERIVENELGRPLRGRWAVATRCHLGLPMVIENHPRLAEGAPFPTLFWLTCPLLVKRAGHLESVGVMGQLNGQLSSDRSFRRRLVDAMARYKRRRDEREPLGDVAPPGGGPDRVKCLHAHLAHELADPPNPVGAVTLRQAGWPDCVAPCVATQGEGTD